MQTRSLMFVLAAAALAACGSARDDAALEAGALRGAERAMTVTVMTRNLFVGADLFAPFTSEDPLGAAADVWHAIQDSDPGTRMEAIADEIVLARPDLVGLQEAYRFVVTPFGETEPVLLDIDFLGSLETALAARDHPLQRVVEQVHTVLTVPFGAVQVTMIDRDAILADVDVDVLTSGGGNFAAEYVTTLADVIPVHLTRGWTEATVQHDGVEFTFVNTHLEVKEFGPLQALQAIELLERFGSVAPLVLVGDTNSDPRDPPNPFEFAPGGFLPTPYTTLSSLLTDAWPGVGGLTCCFDPDLTPPTRPLYERVDLVLTTPGFSPTFTFRIGFQPLPALALPDGPPRWPSDHAGVVAFLGLDALAGPQAVAAR